jgi:hypothetical protein
MGSTETKAAGSPPAASDAIPTAGGLPVHSTPKCTAAGQERQEERERWEMPRYAVAKLGPTRWYWYAVPNGEWYWTRDHYDDWGLIPAADGYATTETEAVAEAMTAAGPDAIRDRIGWARARHREKVARRRAAKPSTKTDTGAVEYVWAYYHSYEDRPGRWERHQVIKRTKKRLFVRARPVDDDRGWNDPHAEAIVIDRETFERDGYASAWKRLLIASGFYREPFDWDTSSVTPMPPSWAMTVLELAAPSTLADVEAAYRRLARDTHPDTGGDAEAFITIRNAYDAARAVFPVGHDHAVH